MSARLSAAVILVIAGIAANAFLSIDAAAHARNERPPRDIDRVLIVSIPYVSWADLEELDVPNLDELLSQSAVANLTTRTIGRTDLASGYVTLGAGTRARGASKPSDGAAFGVDERFGDVTARDAFFVRTGRAPGAGIVHLGIAPIDAANAEEPVSVEVGALGKALRRGDYRRAVIANADGTSPDEMSQTYHRDAVAALMDPRGRLGGGRVADTLTEPHATSPFGVRADLDAFADAFRRSWRKHSVVLVEASDVVRARAAASLATPEQQSRSYRRAVERFDRLVGELRKEVEPDRDAVLVVSPTPSSRTGTLTVAALRAPTVGPGLLRSASTRRPGYVLLADVAPTVVDLVGLPRDTTMKGRPFTLAVRTGDFDARSQDLRQGAGAALFRDRVRQGVTLTVVVGQGVLALAAVLAFRRDAGPSVRSWLRLAALVALGFVPAVYLARLVAFHDIGVVPYSLFLAGLAVVLGLAYERIGRHDELDSLIAALGTICVLLVSDVVLGANLELSSAFGYSPTIGVRVAGFGNVSYALLSASALLLAGLVAHRVPGRRGRLAALGILSVALVADVSPFWGSDVGGALSMVPAFGVAAALLLGIRIRRPVRVLLISIAAVVVAITVVAAVDLARPTDERTHLGRLIEDVRDQGPTELTDTLVRKLDQNLATLTSSTWRFLVPICLAFLAYLYFGRERLLTRLVRSIPELRAVLIGFAVLAVLGYALNDSGITIPGAMLAILDASLVVILMGGRLGAGAEDAQIGPAHGVARTEATRLA